MGAKIGFDTNYNRLEKKDIYANVSHRSELQNYQISMENYLLQLQ